MAVAVIATATPAVAGGARGGSTTYIVTTQHSASATISLAQKATFDVQVTRPSSKAKYLAFELVPLHTSGWLYYAYVDHAGESMVGFHRTKNGNVIEGTTFGMMLGGTAPPTIDLGTVSPPADTYRLTVVTSESSRISFDPVSGSDREVRVHATRRTTANGVSGSYGSSTPAESMHRSLPLRIPAHARVAMLVANDAWSGNQSVRYVNACFGPTEAQAQCVNDSAQFESEACVETALTYCAVQPTTENGDGGETIFAIDEAPPAGTGADLYTMTSGTVTHQSLTAVALP